LYSISAGTPQKAARAEREDREVYRLEELVAVNLPKEVTKALQTKLSEAVSKYQQGVNRSSLSIKEFASSSF